MQKILIIYRMAMILNRRSLSTTWSTTRCLSLILMHEKFLWNFGCILSQVQTFRSIRQDQKFVPFGSAYYHKVNRWIREPIDIRFSKNIEYRLHIDWKWTIDWLSILLFLLIMDCLFSIDCILISAFAIPYQKTKIRECLDWSV